MVDLAPARGWCSSSAHVKPTTKQWQWLCKSSTMKVLGHYFYIGSTVYQLVAKQHTNQKLKRIKNLKIYHQKVALDFTIVLNDVYSFPWTGPYETLFIFFQIQFDFFPNSVFVFLVFFANLTMRECVSLLWMWMSTI